MLPFHKRWLKAQDYERSFWEKAASHIVSGISGQLDWYGWRVGELEKRLNRFINDNWKQSAYILEIGSGPVGIISFLKWGTKFAIDPLENYYKNVPVLIELRDKDVKYLKGKGEELHFKNGIFSLVILDNVIDHTENPDRVLKEIYRVLKIDGILYISVNIHNRWGAKLHHFLSLLTVDKGHPHTFTKDKIENLIRANNFRIEDEITENYYEAKGKDCRSKSLKSKTKGFLGLTEFLYQVVCIKR